MLGLGFGELLIILVVVLLFFGARRLPQIGEGLGRGIGEFKKGMKNPVEKNAGSATKTLLTPPRDQANSDAKG